ncbi:MAG: response regulator [Pseudomonadota bacterium]
MKTNDDHSIRTEPKIVLLIEENASHAELLTEIFDRHFSPIIIHTVDDLDKAIQLLRQNQYDLILSDCMLGETSLLNHFSRLSDMASGTPIIVISGVDDAQMSAKLAKKGAAEYISKRAESLDALPNIISKYFRRKQSRPKAKEPLETRASPSVAVKKIDDLIASAQDFLSNNDLECQKNLVHFVEKIISELGSLRAKLER